MPLVSIIIPSYNSASTLPKAVDSALVQSYESVEVIVIDDGSRDETVSVLESYGDRIRWETGPNRGACAARNRGLQLAQGDLIQFLDADDWLYPQKLERQVACLLTSPGKTPVCNGEVIHAGQIVRRYLAPETCDDSLIPLLNGPLPTPAPLHLRSTLQRVGGFREELPCSQERDLHLRLASHGWPLQRVNEPLYAVRRLPGSVSSSSEKVLDQHLPIALRVRAILEQRHAWTDTNAKALACFLTRDARNYVRLGCREKAAEYFGEALRFHPSGGWDAAYGRWTRIAASLLGPVTLERLLTCLR